MVLSPGFDVDRTIFFTFSEPDAGGNSRTAVARAVLGDTAISDVKSSIARRLRCPGSMHYGSRLVFDREGYLFVTLGERGEQDAGAGPGDDAGQGGEDPPRRQHPARQSGVPAAGRQSPASGATATAIRRARR